MPPRQGDGEYGRMPDRDEAERQQVDARNQAEFTRQRSGTCRIVMRAQPVFIVGDHSQHITGAQTYHGTISYTGWGSLTTGQSEVRVRIRGLPDAHWDFVRDEVNRLWPPSKIPLDLGFSA
jgi:hypothetical protein